MRKYIEIKATLFLLGLQIVDGQDHFGNQNAEVEYSNVFQNIPTLFEYLLDTLEEKPEVLEKNDADLFKAEEEIAGDVTRFKRSANEKHNEERSLIGDNNLHESTSERQDKGDGKAMKSRISYTRHSESNRNIVGKGSTDEHESRKENEIEDEEDVIWPLYEDVEKLFGLTSEEIAEQALKVEEMLEKHNNSK